MWSFVKAAAVAEEGSTHIQHKANTDIGATGGTRLLTCRQASPAGLTASPPPHMKPIREAERAACLLRYALSHGLVAV